MNAAIRQRTTASNTANRFATALLAAAVIAACSTTRTDEAPIAQTHNVEVAPAPAPQEAAKELERQESARGQLAEAAAVMPPAQLVRRAPGAPPPPLAAAPSLDSIQVTGSRINDNGLHFQVSPANTEKYATRTDNPVHRASEQPVSTFSIDVDTGSYSNVRRMLAQGVRPPADAVRAEEFLNYFDYGHAAPASREVPFRVTTELAPAPWNGKRQLLMVGIKGYDVPKAALPPANLVFLIDTSGSMQSPDKLPLVKESLRQLVPQLRAQDRVSMVVYAGSAGLVLPPTPGDRHAEILAALDRLEAGGSTNGGDGIRLAYAMARQAFVAGGINRVILASDGDFNVGTVDDGALKTLVADQRRHRIALTTLGFGQGNYNDALAEQLADVGDGQHAYIDSLREARKVLVQQMGGTLLTIARDVKIQVEFNPAVVAEYRLIGYENRLLQREDFANDRVDAGDIGAGHQVTALYEVTLAGSGAERLPALRYGAAPAANAKADELAHLRLRYKRPGEARSRLIEAPVLRSQQVARAGESLRFAAAVAGFADALRGGTRLDGWGWEAIAATARDARGRDPRGERAEFIAMLGQARALVAAQPDATASVSE